MARKDARAKRPMVVSRHGKYRFQTGMVTAKLLQRGLPMAAAFAVSRELRQSLIERHEVTTDELKAELERLLAASGHDTRLAATDIDEESEDAPEPLLVAGQQAIDHHKLLRDLGSIGMPPDQAAHLISTLDSQLRQLEQPVAREQREQALDRMLVGAGTVFQQRHLLIDWIRTSEQPVVLFIGGATGTGKSTLAMELAFRLGIRMVVSTDMIRETMRTVLSAQVVPGLHDHSFRGMLQGGQVLSDPQERVLAGFRQQASQVSVGVRAVIRRAVRENTHMVVEGTHIMPPFDQYLPEDTAHAGLILAVPSEAKHRARFPLRASRAKKRDAATYLDAFQSVRWIHDDLLVAAEETEAPVLPTGNLQGVTMAAFDYFAQVLPKGARHPVEIIPRLSDVPTLFLILDGLPDEPHPALDNLTPLQAAHTPYLKMLAQAGGQGQIMTAPVEGNIPHTDEGIWSLIGVEVPEHRIGRGIFEAVGQDVPLTPGAVFLRGNLATQREDESLVDRRAGRIAAGQADLLAGLRNIPLAGGVRGSIFPGLEHRVVVMLRGPDLSECVSNTDPGGTAAIQQVLNCHPTNDTPEAGRTATALRELLRKAQAHLRSHPHNKERVARGLLPANCIITRGAASTNDLPKVQHSPDHAALVAACATALGVARLVGMHTATGATMTGGMNTDLDAKFDMAAELLATRSLVVIHFKGTDIAAHERRPLAKRDYISRIDAALGKFLVEQGQVSNGLRVVVSADHATSSISGNHLADPVPVLVATWQGPGEEADFDEASAEHGALGMLGPGELAQMLWTG
jgi:2,3-bisphosphoglycerate-independent phosphoglycerate mutase